jgi:hydrogenase-1 operon protein HyaF
LIWVTGRSIVQASAVTSVFKRASFPEGHVSGIDSIPVRVEGGDGSTHNLRPLLLQVEHALKELRDGGQGTVIDLSAMPFSEQDEQDLRRVLGQGEVIARVDAFGPSQIQETAVSGVWLVEHLDAEEKRLMLHVEITRIPTMLVTPAEDIDDGVDAMIALNAEQTETP